MTAKPLPRIITLVPTRFEDGSWTGVARFERELRRVIPGVRSLRSIGTPWWKLRRWLALRGAETVVITVNQEALVVPQEIRTIVVHHGCAQTHYDRDPDWRGSSPERWRRCQGEMYHMRNRWYVAPSEWVAREFSHHYGVPEAPVIPSWVEPLVRAQKGSGRKVVLGDWRTFNKGNKIIEGLRRRLPHLEFRALRCTYESRAGCYAEADCYLCLSLSEGASFSMSDAEAASLPIVTTDVGNFLEYQSSYVIPWRRREDVGLVAATIEKALSQPRGPSFFEIWTRERCENAWKKMIQEVAGSSHREPLIKG